MHARIWNCCSPIGAISRCVVSEKKKKEKKEILDETEVSGDETLKCAADNG